MKPRINDISIKYATISKFRNTNITTMNAFIIQRYDKFKDLTIIETTYSGRRDGQIFLRYRSSSPDKLVIGLEVVKCGVEPRLMCGELIMLIDSHKRYFFRPKSNLPTKVNILEHYTINGYERTPEYTEYVFYEISKDILLEMCNAETIEFNVTGTSVDKILRDDPEKPSFILMAKTLYNAVFDNTVFNEDIHNEELRLKK